LRKTWLTINFKSIKANSFYQFSHENKGLVVLVNKLNKELIERKEKEKKENKVN
jgi:hypothetical protein